MRRRIASLTVLVALCLVPGAVPVAPASAKAAAQPAVGSPAARLGGRGFGARPGFGRSYGRRPYGYGRNYGRRRGFGRGFGRGILTGLGISFLLHSFFGYGSGGSPLGLILLFAIIFWLATRGRRRRARYGY